jgi:ABC-type transport system substrate-binding protein
MYHSSQIASGENWIGYANPQADELIDTARAERRFKERAALWRELHGVLAEDQPVTFLLEVPWIRLVGSRLGNVHAYQGTLDRREFFVKSATP